jgi:hypothetical protein
MGQCHLRRLEFVKATAFGVCMGALVAIWGCGGSGTEPSSSSGWNGTWSGDILRSGSRLGQITVTVAGNKVTRLDVQWDAYATGGNSCPARSGTFATSIPIFRCRADYYACVAGGDGTPGHACCAAPNFFVIDTIQLSNMGIGGNGEFTSSTKLEGIVHPQPIGPGLGVCGLYNVPYSATRK